MQPVFLFLAKYRQMAIFFSKMLILAIFFRKLIFLSPKISSNLTIFLSHLTIFIHLSNFSSNYDDSIKNMDESAALFISLVPHI
jgi:hypothetical protein